MSNTPEVIKHAIDATAGIVTVGSLLTYLPYWAAGFTLVWTGLRIFDWIENRIKNNKKPPE